MNGSQRESSLVRFSHPFHRAPEYGAGCFAVEDSDLECVSWTAPAMLSWISMSLNGFFSFIHACYGSPTSMYKERKLLWQDF